MKDKPLEPWEKDLVNTLEGKAAPKVTSMACADYSQQPLSPGRRDVYINIFLHMRDARPVRRCGRAEKQFGILCARVVPHVAVRILSDGELRVEKTGVKVFVCA